jgi:hypothetical protein
MRIATATLLFLTACGPPRPSTLFTSFGRADPTGDADVVARFEQDRTLLILNAKDPDELVKLKSGSKKTVRELAKPRLEATQKVEVLVDTVPAGLEVSERGATVADGSGLVIVGRFQLFYNFAVPLKRALDDTRVLTQAADGNVAVISYLRATQTSTEAVVGLVLKAPAGTTESKNLKPGKMNEI